MGLPLAVARPGNRIEVTRLKESAQTGGATDSRVDRQTIRKSQQNLSDFSRPPPSLAGVGSMAMSDVKDRMKDIIAAQPEDNYAASRRFELVGLDQDFGRDAQPVVQAPDHLDRKWAPAVEHFRHFGSAPQVRLEVLPA
jgi:hypothetical protein